MSGREEAATARSTRWRFIASAHELDQLPPDFGAEIAFAGRSNAGKSSALNAITRQRKLAFASKTPGRTQSINFFGRGADRRLVDLPGYGFAAVSRSQRSQWDRLVSAYIKARKSLKGLVVVVDIRRGIADSDEMLLEWYSPSASPVLVLLTKADKLGYAGRTAALRQSDVALQRWSLSGSVIAFSAQNGTGVRAAENWIQARLK